MADQLSGRGSTILTKNPFSHSSVTQSHLEGLDEEFITSNKTLVYFDTPNNAISKNDSPDLGFSYSINPYQGCEHGCAYCYARNSHNYWGFSAGLDFEKKIIVKKDLAKRLQNIFLSGKWKPELIVMSGNTDCYQPIERKFRLTRELLKIFAFHRHPVGIITKNSLIKRDIDILKDLAREKLVTTIVSVTSLDENLRRKLEPRTASIHQRLSTIESLSKENIPVKILLGPVIPGLNDHEIPSILEKCADAGALSAAYTVIRLNGAVSLIFNEWLSTHFPMRKKKILNGIKQLHGGEVNDSKWKRRLSGDGKRAEVIRSLFNAARKKYFKNKKLPELDYSRFNSSSTGMLF
jgi:DNA repair photolyase